MFQEFINTIVDLVSASGFVRGDWKQFLMIAIACFLIYLAIVKKYEPLLLLPIAFGVLLANLPFANLSSYDGPTEQNAVGGLIYYLY